MKNIEIVVTDNKTIVVFADTKRFGKHQIMFEGYTFLQCCDYIRKVTGKNDFRLNSWPFCKTYTDTEGTTLPIIMNVKV